MPRKKTNNHFLKEVNNLVGDEYVFLEKYINAKTKILVKHSVCNNEYSVSPNNFLRGKRCPICAIEERANKRRKDSEVFIKEIEDLVGGEYIVLGDYKSAKTKILIKHTTCDNKYNVEPNSFLSGGNRCPICASKVKREKLKKSHEIFSEEVYNLVKDEYTLLGKYGANNKEKIEIKHNVCGYEYRVAPANFLSGNRCPKCANPYFNTDTSKFKDRVRDLEGNEYTVLGEYKNSYTKILIIHNKCGNKWLPTPSSFLINGSRCPKCAVENSANRFRTSQEDFENDVYKIVGSEYTVLGIYENNRTGIKIKHNNCGYEYHVAPYSFLGGARCTQCSGLRLKTTKEFIEEVYKLEKKNYSVLGEYVNAKTKVEIRHNKCRSSYKVTPNHFLNGRRCPKCKSSRGESAIREWLISNNLEFKTQYKFNDCVFVRPLPFDFAIFNNGKLIALIEYDGGQHFRPISIWGGVENFKKIKIRDNIKSDYCNINNIPLIRIPYWGFDEIDYELNMNLGNLFLNID